MKTTPITIDPSKLITAREAAIRRGYNVSRIHKLCREGRIRAWKVGQQFLIDPVSLAAFKPMEPGNPNLRKYGSMRPPAAKHKSRRAP